jgi:hypothetical protein
MDAPPATASTQKMYERMPATPLIAFALAVSSSNIIVSAKSERTFSFLYPVLALARSIITFLGGRSNFSAC